MNLPFVLDVAIGLIFIFLICSLLLSEIQELITTILQWRAKHLKESIESLLSGGLSTKDEEVVKDLVDKIYDNPLVKGINHEARGLARYSRQIVRWLLSFMNFKEIFGGDKTTGPSYMAADTFTTALMEQTGLTLLAHKLIEVRLKNFAQRIIGSVNIEDFSPAFSARQKIKILTDNDENLKLPWQKGQIRLIAEQSGFYNLDKDRSFYALVEGFFDIIHDFSSGENTLQVSILRMNESLGNYIENVEGATPLALPEQAESELYLPPPNTEAFVKRLGKFKNSLFGQNGERALASSYLRPSLPEFVELLNQTSQTYQEVKREFEKLVKDGKEIDQKVTRIILDSLLRTEDIELIEQKLLIKYPSEVVSCLRNFHHKICAKNLPILQTRQEEIDRLNEQINLLFPSTRQFCCRVKNPAHSRSRKAQNLARKQRRLVQKNRHLIRSLLQKLQDSERVRLVQNIMARLSDDQLYSDLTEEGSEPHFGLIDCVLDHMPNDERHWLIYNALTDLSNAKNWGPDELARQRSLYANYDTYKRVRIVLEQLPGAVTESFVTLAKRAQSQVTKAEDSVEQFHQEISTWFDQSMARTSGVYKRNAKGISIFLGIAIAFFMNIDTLHITSRLTNDENLRRVVTEVAINVQASGNDLVESASDERLEEGDSGKTQPSSRELQELREEVDAALKDLVLPIGWNAQNLSAQLGCEPNSSENNSIGEWEDFYANCAGFEDLPFLSLSSQVTLGSSPSTGENGRAERTADVIPYLNISFKRDKSPNHSEKKPQDTHWVIRHPTDSFKLGIQLWANHKADTIRMIIGWLISGLAISMGAPFWFDTLNKMVNVRNTGSKPKETPTGSEISTTPTPSKGS